MTGLEAVVLALVVAAGTTVVVVRDPLRQVMVNGAYGIVLTLYFFVLKAPDVALSMLVVGLLPFPLVFLRAINLLRAEPADAAGRTGVASSPDAAGDEDDGDDGGRGPAGDERHSR